MRVKVCLPFIKHTRKRVDLFVPRIVIDATQEDIAAHELLGRRILGVKRHIGRESVQQTAYVDPVIIWKQGNIAAAVKRTLRSVYEMPASVITATCRKCEPAKAGKMEVHHYRGVFMQNSRPITPDDAYRKLRGL